MNRQLQITKVLVDNLSKGSCRIEQPEAKIPPYSSGEVCRYWGMLAGELAALLLYLLSRGLWIGSPAALYLTPVISTKYTFLPKEHYAGKKCSVGHVSFPYITSWPEIKKSELLSKDLLQSVQLQWVSWSAGDSPACHEIIPVKDFMSHITSFQSPWKFKSCELICQELWVEKSLQKKSKWNSHIED